MKDKSRTQLAQYRTVPGAPRTGTTKIDSPSFASTNRCPTFSTTNPARRANARRGWSQPGELSSRNELGTRLSAQDSTRPKRIFPSPAACVPPLAREGTISEAQIWSLAYGTADQPTRSRSLTCKRLSERRLTPRAEWRSCLTHSDRQPTTRRRDRTPGIPKRASGWRGSCRATRPQKLPTSGSCCATTRTTVHHRSRPSRLVHWNRTSLDSPPPWCSQGSMSCTSRGRGRRRPSTQHQGRRQSCRRTAVQRWN
jgi:hypothetical protein